MLKSLFQGNVLTCIAAFLIAISLISCNSSKNDCHSSAKFKIKNETSIDVSVAIIPSKNVRLTISNISAHSLVDTSVCFDKIPHNDGDFLIHIKHTNLDTSIRWGYYTNGTPPSGYIQVNIFDRDVKLIQMP